MQNDATQTLTKDHRLKIRDLSRPTLFPWSIDLAIDWAIMGLAFAACAKASSFLVYFLAAVVIGNRQHALAVLAHEGTHYTVHANRKTNDLLTNLLCFWPILLTVEGYRMLHFMHHNNTGTLNDPELHHKKSRAPQWDLPLQKSKVLSYIIKDFIGYSVPDLWIILTFSRPKDKALFRPVIYLHCALIGATVALGFWWVMPLWYASLATSFMMFFRLRLWMEHQGTFETQRLQLSRLQAAIFAPHKIWLHWEHHKFPTVPYHRLEKARQILPGPMPLSLAELIMELSHANPLPSGMAIEESIIDEAAQRVA